MQSAALTLQPSGESARPTLTPLVPSPCTVLALSPQGRSVEVRDPEDGGRGARREQGTPCPATPIRRPPELAESTGHGPHGQEHRIRQQTLAARLRVLGAKPKVRDCSSPPNAGTWAADPGPVSESQVLAGVGGRAASSQFTARSRWQTSCSQKRGYSQPRGGCGAGRGGRAGRHLQSPAGIVSLWGPPGLHEACLLPQSRDPPAEPHLQAGQSRAQGPASVQG